MLFWSWLSPRGYLVVFSDTKTEFVLWFWSYDFQFFFLGSCEADFRLSSRRVLCHVYGCILDSIGMGLLPGERVISGMSLGRNNSMYGGFKGALRKQFRGFHAASQLHCLCKASNFGRP